MKNRILAVTLILLFGSQIISFAKGYDDAREEFSWVYEQATEEIDESAVGYMPGRVWKELYVAEDGSDANDGSASAPFATLERARNAVREINGDMQGDIVVHIASGFYHMEKKLVLSPEDSGTNGYNVVWLGNKNDMPVISGGKKIGGMSPSREHPGLYEIQLDYPDKILNLYVNGHSRELAAGSSLVRGQKRPDRMDTNEWYEANPLDRKDPYGYFDPETDREIDGIYVSKTDIGIYENLEDVFAVYNASYHTYTLPIEEIFENPDNDEQYIVRFSGAWEYFSKPEWKMWPSGDKSFRVKNAFELLDCPGEFYYNRKTKILYYMPYDGENPETAEVIVPYRENLISVKGDDRENKVKNIVFEGLEFAHTMYNTWTSAGFFAANGTTDLNEGADGLQAGMPGYGVSVGFAENITFKNNFFFGMGGNALWLPSETKYFYAVGNAFADIGDTGLRVDGYGGWTQKYGGGPLELENNEYYKYGTPNAEQKLKPIQLLATSYATLEVSYDEAVKGTDGEFMMGKHVLVNKDKHQNFANRAGLRKTWVDKYEYQQNAWRGDPNASEKGINNWVKYDFGSEYSVSKIALAFADGIVEDNEKNNYEILLSNDRYFSEGSYVTATRQTTPAETVQEYELDITEKYRYMMIKTITPSPLAISGVWALSPDEAPYPTESRSKYIYIQNNKFTRMGVNIENASAITLYFAENKVVSHNEISSVGYCGILLMAGQSVGQSNAQKYGLIANNLITDTNKLHGDGSGIYYIGFGGYNVIENNYLSNNNVGIFGYYSDGGAAAWLMNSNIAEDVPTSYSFYYKQADSDGTTKSSVMGNISRNMYSPHNIKLCVTELPEPYYDDYYENWYSKENDAEEPIIYVRGQPSGEVYAIRKNAGLEDEFTWLNYIIPDDDDHNLDLRPYYVDEIYGSSILATNRRISSMKYEAENILTNGVFGVGLGELDPIYKGRIKKLNDKMSLIEGSGYMEISRLSDFERVADENIEMKKLLRDVAESVNRYSLSETLSMCKELESGAIVDDGSSPDIGTVSGAAKKKLSTAIDDAELQMAKAYTAAEELEMLIALENAYNEFCDSVRCADIEYAYSAEADRIDVDGENRTVDIYVPSDVDLTAVDDIELIPKASASLQAPTLGSEYINGKTVSVTCTSNGVTADWTVTLRHEQPTDSKYLKGESFSNEEFGKSRVKKSKNGTLLPASSYAYFSDSVNRSENGGELLFKPYEANGKNKFTFYIGADYSEYAPWRGGRRIEAEFSDGNVKLYSVGNDSKILLAEENADINYNGKNRLTYSFNEDNKSLTLTLNGSVLLDEASVENISSPSFGIYSPWLNVEVLDKLYGKDNIDIAHTVDGDTLTSSVQTDISNIWELIGEKSGFGVVTAVYKAQTLCRAEYAAVDAASSESVELTGSLTVDLSGLENGEYTAKTYVLDSIKSLKPLNSAVKQTAVEINKK